MQFCGEQGFYLWGNGVSSYVLFSSLSLIFFLIIYLRIDYACGFFPLLSLSLKLPCPFGFWKYLLIIQSKNYWHLVFKKSQLSLVLLLVSFVCIEVTLMFKPCCSSPFKNFTHGSC